MRYVNIKEVVVVLTESPKRCFPGCESFRCGQKALVYKSQRIYCRWADDDCSGPECNYAICLQRRLVGGGLCSLTIRRKTDEEIAPEDLKIDVKAKGKLLRRFRDDELI